MALSSLTPRKITLIIFISAYILLAIQVMLVFISSNAFLDMPRLSATQMISGTAHRPYVYRLVVPKLTWIIVQATPASIETSFNDTLSHARLGWLENMIPALQRIISESSMPYTRAILAMIMTAFLGFYVYMQYRLGALLFAEHPAVALFSPIVGLILIPACRFPQLMIYDPAVLFFTSVCYFTMARRQWHWYLFWFFLATLNKETSIYLVIFYCLYFYSRLPHKEFFRYLAFQLVIYGYTKLSINLYYMNNPGDYLEDHFRQHINALINSRYYVQDVFLLFTSAYLLFSRWQGKPLFARYGLFIVAAIYLSYCIYGNVGEYRVFFDIFPLLTLLLTDTLVVGTGISTAAIFNRR